MQLILYTLIALSLSSLHGMTSIDTLKKLNPSSLTQDQKIGILSNDRAKSIFSEFERITKLSSEKTLANAYKILDFDLSQKSAQSPPQGLYTSRLAFTQPAIAWLIADKTTIEFMQSVQNALIAVYNGAAATLKDTTLIQSRFDSAITSPKYTKEVETALREIYYTYEFFPSADSVPDEVFMATLLLFSPEFTQKAEETLRKRTDTKMVKMINERTIQSAQDWVNMWSPFFTNQANSRTGILLNTVSYRITPVNGADTLVGLAAQQLINFLKIEPTKNNLEQLENLKKSISTPWWASRGNQYFTKMMSGIPIMPLILRAQSGYFLALEWQKFFPGKAIDDVAELVTKALATAQQSGLKNAINFATFQNTIIGRMGKSLVGPDIVALKKEPAGERAKKLLKILEKPEHVADLIYYRQRTTYPIITISDIENVITQILSEQAENDPSTLIALATRVCKIDLLTQSKALSAGIVDQAREILFTAFATSLDALAREASTP